MADEAIVCLVGLSEYDRLTDLAADDASFTDRAGVNTIAKDGTSRRDRARSDEARERANDGILSDQDRSCAHIEHHVWLDCRAPLYEHALVSDNGDVGGRRTRERRTDRGDVVTQLREQVGDEMPNLLEPSAGDCRDTAIVRRQLL